MLMIRGFRLFFYSLNAKLRGVKGETFFCAFAPAKNGLAFTSFAGSC